MFNNDDTKMPLTSEPPLERRKDELKELFPEVFREDKIDFDRLRQALGEDVATGRERYGLSWAGKGEAVRAVQIPSVGTLVPDRAESVDFDATENLFIEGDNLEVLKLLQKSYYGKIKMIYIDPPYNTGNEFIYPDNFSEGIHDYLIYSGQIDGEGFQTTTNTETSGRYHSKWLDMLYPRIFLAKNLLAEDGVIFVSIDDHEVHNLRQMMNEVFGEENFFSQIIVRSNSRGQTYRQIAKTHEYLLAYTRSEFSELNELPKEGNKDDLNMNDDIGRFNVRELRNRNPKFGRHNRPNLFFPIFVNPDISDDNGFSPVSLKKNDKYRIKIIPLNSNNEESCWRWGKKRVEMNININTQKCNLVAKPRKNGSFMILEKYRKTTYKPKSIWDDNGFLNETGTTELRQLNLAEYFEFPKPVSLIEQCIRLGTNEEDIILDFFSGSAPTAHAVLKSNREDESDRRFILVQLPEPTPDKSEAHKAGYKTIADIGKERIRRVIKKLEEDNDGKLAFKGREQPEDLGFRVFKLGASNFKIWECDEAPTAPEALGEQLKMFADHVLQGRPEEAVLYELILKSGLPLTAKIEIKQAAGKKVHLVGEKDALLAICLEKEVTKDALRAMMEFRPQRVLCIDSAFEGNDQLKTNTVLEMKSHEIEFRTV